MTGEIPDRPLTMSDNCLRLTPSPLAASVTVSPNGSRQSYRTDRPGWGGSLDALPRNQRPFHSETVLRQLESGYLSSRSRQALIWFSGYCHNSP